VLYYRSQLRRDAAGLLACPDELPGLDSVTLSEGNAELASQTLWAGIHGITSLLITHGHFPWVGREKVVQSTVDTMVAGLVAGGK